MKILIVLSFVLIWFGPICFDPGRPAIAAPDKFYDNPLFNQGVALLSQDKFDKAIEVFTRLIVEQPDNADALRNRGVGYMRLGRYDKAITDFEAALKINKELKGLYSNLGVGWYYKGDFKKAIDYYNQEIALRPDNSYAYFNRAISWAKLDQFDSSLEDVNKSLDLFSGHYLVWCLQGDLLVKKKRVSQAATAYEKAISLEPDQAYAKTRLAQLKKIKQNKSKQPVTSKKSSVQPVRDHGGAYEIQMGAFQVRKNAEKMVKDLADKGYSARIFEIERPDKRVWFLVRIGRFDSLEKAKTQAMRIKTKIGAGVLVRPHDMF